MVMLVTYRRSLNNGDNLISASSSALRSMMSLALLDVILEHLAYRRRF